VIATYFGSTAAIAGGNEIPMNFNFPLSDRILAGVNSGNSSGITAKLAEVSSLYPAGIIDVPFLTNHDQIRLATQLKKEQRKLRQAVRSC
jgi:hypothetical protein